MEQAIECEARLALPGAEFGHLLDGESHIVRRVGGRGVYHLAIPVAGNPERVRLDRLEPGPMPPRTSHVVTFYCDASDRVVISEAIKWKRPRPFYLM